MLREFLELIQSTAVKASEPSMIPVDDCRTTRFAYGGEIHQYVIPPAVREDKVLDIDDFMAAVVHWGSNAVVYHDHKQVVCIVDDKDRRDRVTLPLLVSETFTLVSSLKGKPMDHKAFVTLLKNDLRGCAPESLLPLVRKLDVSTGSRTSSDVQHGRERGTREFQAELAGAAELPEVIDLAVSVYANVGLRKSRLIRCSLDVEIPGLVFRFAPLPDELSQAVDAAQRDLGDILTGGLGDVAVFHGSPGVAK